VRLLDGSGMSGDVHVPFCEGLRVRFPWSTLLPKRITRSKTRLFAQSLPSLVRPCKAGIGRSSPYATAPGRVSALATNGEFLTKPGLLD
jgi:hypothetical protein